jgi:hypothetical protein
MVTDLDSSDPHVRFGAVRGLANLPQSAVLPHAKALASTLKDPDDDVRLLAAQTLGELPSSFLSLHAPALVACLGIPCSAMPMWNDSTSSGAAATTAASVGSKII